MGLMGFIHLYSICEMALSTHTPIILPSSPDSSDTTCKKINTWKSLLTHFNLKDLNLNEYMFNYIILITHSSHYYLMFDFTYMYIFNTKLSFSFLGVTQYSIKWYLVISFRYFSINFIESNLQVQSITINIF